jgi:hypothetical protein
MKHAKDAWTLNQARWATTPDDGGADDLDDGMRIVVAPGAGEVGGPEGRIGPEMPQKNILHRFISVLRSDNSSVNRVLFTADRL